MAAFEGDKTLYGEVHEYANPDYVKWLEEQVAVLTNRVTDLETIDAKKTEMLKQTHQRLQACQDREAARIRYERDSLPHYDRD